MTEKLPERPTLSVSERAERDRLVAVILGARNAAEDQLVLMKMALVDFQRQRLYRETHDSLDDWADEVLGISVRSLYRWVQEGVAAKALEERTGSVPRASEMPSQRGLSKRKAAIDTPSVRTKDGQGMMEPDQVGAQTSKAGPQSNVDPPTDGTDPTLETSPSGTIGKGTGPGGARKPEPGREAASSGPSTVAEGAAPDTNGTAPEAPPLSLQAAVKRLLMSDAEELATLGRGTLAELVAHLRPMLVRPVPSPKASKDCRHPVGRRIGDECMVCGEKVAKAR